MSPSVSLRHSPSPVIPPAYQRLSGNRRADQGLERQIALAGGQFRGIFHIAGRGKEVDACSSRYPGLPQWQWYRCCSFWGNGRSALYHHEVSKPQQQAPPVAASGLLQPPIFTDVLIKNGGFAGPRIITLKEQRSLAGRPWDVSARTRHRARSGPTRLGGIA